MVKLETKSIKKLPYGQSNFEELIRRNYAYVDKTRYIEMLENENNTYQFFIRPRRFGKSLFLSVLENYYGIGKPDDIFDNLYIGKNPTPEKNKYAILKVNFSNLDTTNYEDFKKSFIHKVQEAVFSYFNRYSSYFQNVQEIIHNIYNTKPGLGILNILYNFSEKAGLPLFVIIDEYDHFANNLIAMGKSYMDEIRAGSIVRSFFEILKTGTNSIVKRIFITGINPMMLNDLTSGFNIATDYSIFPRYNEMMGFTSDEVEWLIQETGVDKTLINVDMEKYYNGYLFNDESINTVYNPQMVMFLFNQIEQLGKQPKQIIDGNLQTDYNRIKKLAESPNNRDKLFKIANEGGVYSNIIEKFSIEQIEDESYFISFLFYMGLLTIDKSNPLFLKIPNYSIKTLFWQYLVSQDSSMVESSR